MIIPNDDIDDIFNNDIFRIVFGDVSRMFSNRPAARPRGHFTINMDNYIHKNHVYITAALKARKEHLHIEIGETKLYINLMENGHWKQEVINFPATVSPKTAQTNYNESTGILDIKIKVK